MATDYDAQRKTDDDTESIEAIKERIPSKPSISDDDADNADNFTIPDVVNEELEVVVLPQQENEFTCINCFLVKPRAQLGKKSRSGPICLECNS
ncbi:MAG: dUTPase [Candidatus Aquiluna sp. XM-24bin5]|nr:MAG: dUTPase [Candidatus Aquiluna sp. XM-24bin5]